MKNKHILFTILLSSLLFSLRGQTLDDARNWYLEGRYADALPVFQGAFTADSTHAALNQWLGVSLLKTGRIMDAERHLIFAAGNRIPEATLYLGELYGKLYRFDDAEQAYEKYQKAHRRDKEALARLEQFREETAQLQRRALRTEDVQIIDSLVLPKRDFLAAYHLSHSSGTLKPLHDFFNNLPAGNETLHLNERGDKLYYSKESPESGHDLYTMDKLLNSFGNERKLPETINGKNNQAYPFVMNDGLTIYFASMEHQSLGGYDLFVTRYNLATDSYLTPNQLNMPFNSPFNDYMMAIDEEKGVGWFASDRFQPEGFLCVYTFLPNPQVTLVEQDEPAYTYRRARISSIAETWREGVDYGSLRMAARQEKVTEPTFAADFEFILNDEWVYQRLEDFTGDRARTIFSQVLGLKKQLEELKGELQEKRELVASSGAADGRLASSILELEKESETLYRQIERLKNEARNEEIRQLPKYRDRR
ncbi:MAG: tetratricopeptide repeat protein [Proteiniphilum sp.]|nr:tetratricopeptide repeat protein [Proteiniphilum sp.]